MPRKINELIWHCSATPEGRETTVKEIDRWHHDRGFKRSAATMRTSLTSIGYHILVHLDGSVSLGRDPQEGGAHVAGRNANTLGYCYVGGLDKNTLQPKDTRTKAQKATMLRLTKAAIAAHGLKLVSGHRQYAKKACPCFDAQAEYRGLIK